MPRPPAITQAERRLHQRYPVQAPIRLYFEGRAAPIALATTNLSLYGCSILTSPQLPVGIEVYARLSLGAHHIRIRGRVVTRHPELGNGIMFMNFKGDGEERLRQFLEGLAPLAEKFRLQPTSAI
jgi:hypothetical protein